MEPFLGQIIMFGGNFAPRGWALCDGQLLPISQNSALFSILGTTYGGDGVNTFGLPDLRGRVPMHAGTGHGLTPRRLGEKTGAESHTLTVAEMPAHTHDYSPPASSDPATATEAKNSVPGTTQGLPVYSQGAADSAMRPGAVQSAGGGQSFDITQPSGCVNFIIALTGTYPSRD